MMCGSELVVSFLTLTEMRQGALDTNWDSANGTCWKHIWQTSQYSIQYLLRSRWAAIRNESTRKGRQMSSADAWIAATALVLSVPLVKNNPNDYRHLEKLQLVPWRPGRGSQFKKYVRYNVSLCFGIYPASRIIWRRSSSVA
jgi:predicted nucleic acid-binding protein